MRDVRVTPALSLLALALFHAVALSAAPAKKPGRHGRDGGAADPALASSAPGANAVGSATPAAPHPPEERTWASCTEHIPSGATRPVVKESFPSRALSGYAATLEVTIEHGKGETVLPQGFQFQSSGAAARSLQEAGFVFPDVDGGAGPTLATTATPNGATTKVSIPVLLLPKEPGRNKMLLPPVPIAVARASGELLTLCTEPHPVVVEDPTSSTPDAKPHPNPAPRQQVEEWTLAKQLTIGALAGAVLAAVAAWLVGRWMRRPRPLPPPPPPRPPWEVALEELFAVRYAGLAKEARYAEHYDRISDAVRKYLGGRYGFDGLETTTHEMTAILSRVQPAVYELPVIFGFLEECDLVKFARFTPSDEDCTRVLDQAEHIVRITVPPQLDAPPPTARVPAGAGGSA
ncbi:MAG TPA: hypothetical protein VK550_20940 [Polyangiaceae bacterium]|jgi:hypothetical protein|nr:hypothetical protein [Polyangiaceae bacterium]